VGLTDGMVEWVVGHTMHYHLELDRQIHNPNQEWDDTPPPLAKDRHVTILGLGELGAACGQALANLGFQVSGWSRTAKDIPNITCHSDNDGLNAALSAADTLVLLLPQTPQTENVINADTLEVLKPGAVILNPGRGTLIDDQALISALDRGQIRAATLDVFRVEPLPLDHAYWAHPKVTVTPHIASTTRPDTASQIIAENIDRCESGLPLLHTVDRLSGY
ncbi:MAG: NAD(P)-dependent oxidoreductase, partial [Planktomarina sp.]